MLKEAEIKELESEFNCDWCDEPICPYCGHVQEDDLGDFVGDWNDETQWEAWCSNCDEKYLCFTSVKHSFSSVKAPCLNSEPHKMRYRQKLWENKHVFQCIWCNRELRKELSAFPTIEEKQDFYDQ